MKLNNKIYFSLLLIITFVIFGCNSTQNSEGVSVKDIKNPATASGMDKEEQSNLPEITFENLVYDFGKVIEGEKLTYTFHFKNTGKSNLLISYVEASCGCTTSVPPKAPVKPGEKSQIQISFDSKYKSGEMISYLVVTGNTYPAQTVLTVIADVVKP